MTRYTLTPLLIALLLALSGCNQSATTDNSSSLEAQAWALMDQGALILDVRTQQEFDGGHLHNAIHIPHDQISEKFSSLNVKKDQQIVLYCRSGKRAGKAEATLREMGYSNIFNGGGYQPLMKHKQP